MGSNISNNAEAQAYGVATFNPDQWNRAGSILRRSPSVSVLHSREHYESNDVYESIHDTLLVEKYQFQYNQNEHKDLMEHLYWRKQCPQFVPVLFINNKIEATLCRQSHSIKVYLEHMPLRLTKVNDIPFPQNLYVLRQALRGFRKAYSYYKQLIIHQDQICISQDCKVKIWVNPNLVSRLPHRPGCRTLKTQGKIVASIIDLIATNTDHTLEPVDIREFLRSKHKKYTFEGVLRSIEQFAIILKLQIPRTLESARIFFQRSIYDPLTTTLNHWQQPSTGNECSNQFGTDENKIKQNQFIPLLYIRNHRAEEQLSYVSKDSNNCSTEMVTPQKTISSRSDLESFHRNLSTSFTSRRQIKNHIAISDKYFDVPLDNQTQSEPSLIHTLKDSEAQPQDQSSATIVQVAREESLNQQTLQILSPGKGPQWPYFQGEGVNYIDNQIATDLTLMGFKEQ